MINKHFNSMTQKLYKRQQGMTLVELMIAIVLGLLVSAAAIQLFLANKRSYLLIENSSAIQSHAVMSMDILTKSAAISGYVPNVDSFNNGTGVAQLFAANAVTSPAKSYLPSGGTASPFNEPNEVISIEDNILNGSDIFSVRFKGEEDENLFSPCTGSQITSNRMAEIRYYVREKSGMMVLECLESIYTLDSANQYINLYSENTAVLATNVHTFQVERGLYNSTSNAIVFAPYADTAAIADIDSIKFYLVLRSENDVSENANTSIKVSNSAELDLTDSANKHLKFKMFRTFQFTGSLESLRNFVALQTI